jgi:hypothetical protein
MCADGFQNVTLLPWYLITTFFLLASNSSMNLFTIIKIYKNPSKNPVLKEALKAAKLILKHFAFLRIFPASNKCWTSKQITNDREYH